MTERAQAAAAQFALDAPARSVRPLGGGHINETYVVEVSSRRRYVLQRINRAVFPDPEAVARNTARVIRHLEAKVREEGGDRDREVVTLVPTRAGDAFLRDDEEETWRCSVLVEHSTSRSSVARPVQARNIAATFGRFLRRLADLPPETLEPTLPGLHDTLRHLEALRAIAEDDPVGRAGSARPELEAFGHRADAVEAWGAFLASGERTVGAIHNDTKVDNVLVDTRTGRGICVIDLDTVMPGSPLVDIADCARSTLTGPEDRGRPIDLRLFDGVVRGFLGETGGLLSAREIEAIVLATRNLALELGMRFLADHLAGDRWFPVGRRWENLARCRAQLELVRQIEYQAEAMAAIVRRAAARDGRSRRGGSTADALRFRIHRGRTQG